MENENICGKLPRNVVLAPKNCYIQRNPLECDEKSRESAGHAYSTTSQRFKCTYLLLVRNGTYVLGENLKIASKWMCTYGALFEAS